MHSQHPNVEQKRKFREKPNLHFRRVAKMWEAIIGYSVTPEQVVLCMAALKIAREAGNHEDDNIVDATGYLSLIPEIRMYEEPAQMASKAPLDKDVNYLHTHPMLHQGDRFHDDCPACQQEISLRRSM